MLSRARRFCLAVACGALVVAASSRARADDGTSGNDETDERPHYVWAGTLAAIELAIPAWYYWDTQKAQEVDWTLKWDWASWKEKLLPPFSAVRFDTNPFHVNALRHPLTGIGDYEIARSSELGMRGAMILTWVTGIAWEYFVEYREDPAINDMIMNGVGGVALGEPLFQIGELFRGDDASLFDDAKLAITDPFALAGDLAHVTRRHRRPHVWREIRGGLGADQHQLDAGAQRVEATGSFDIDLVRDRNYLHDGAAGGATGPGAWSRLTGSARLGNPGGGTEMVDTTLRSRTSFGGRYEQDDAGNGFFYGLGTAFTYRRDRLAAEWDRLALAEIIGPQLQWSSRTPARAWRWDLAAYLDFGMVQAHVFGPHPAFPPPPPYLSTLQANGYYMGGGTTAESRVRYDAGRWRADGELGVTQLWSLDFRDRDNGPSYDSTTRLPPAPASTTIPATPHGVADARVYAHGELGYEVIPSWTVAAVADAAVRHGTWQQLSRTTTDATLGAQLVHAF